VGFCLPFAEDVLCCKRERAVSLFAKNTCQKVQKNDKDKKTDLCYGKEQCKEQYLKGDNPDKIGIDTSLGDRT
jgi:hypothetical protein